MEKKVLKTSATLDQLKKDMPEEGLSLKEFLNEIGNKGRYILIIILTAPFIIPVSIPGSSMPFGLFIFLLELSNLLGKEAYLPDRISGYHISHSSIIKIFETLEKVMTFVEKVIKPRLYIFINNNFLLKLKSVFVMILSLLLLLPLPIPLTDFVPALAILTLSIGTLEKDGLLVVCGYIFTIGAIYYFISIGYFGIEGIKLAFKYLGITF